MDKKALVTKICADIKQAPGLFDGLKKEAEKILDSIVVQNIKDISEIKSETEFYDFIAGLGDELITLRGPLEILDGPAIRFFLKKIVDPIIDKKAGKDWYEKFQSWIKSLVK